MFFNPKKGGLFWQLRRRGGGGWSYVPTDKQSTAEATIFILHQQSASHMKDVTFNVHLRSPNKIAEVSSLASMPHEVTDGNVTENHS